MALRRSPGNAPRGHDVTATSDHSDGSIVPWLITGSIWSYNFAFHIDCNASQDSAKHSLFLWRRIGFLR